jgi:hypothetical protein
VVLGDVLKDLYVVFEGLLLFVQFGERQGYGVGVVLDFGP